MSNVDTLAEMLREGPYEPGRTLRRIVAPDGSEKLQVRLPLGIEQYELDGRPDGQRPHGRESYLELFLERLEDRTGPRRLSKEECTSLFEEGVLYYFRYLLCFQMGDFDRVIRDTRRNLQMFDLLGECCEDEEDKVRVDQYRPYVIRMLAAATALQQADAGEADKAEQALRNAIADIERLELVPGLTFELEKKRSLSILRGMIEEMHKQVPSEAQQLRDRLRAAVDSEDYERAAKLRDVLRAMGEER